MDIDIIGQKIDELLARKASEVPAEPPVQITDDTAVKPKRSRAKKST